MRKLSRPATLVALLAACVAAHAQSSCDSDGRTQPVALVERFISADCEACWAEAGALKLAPGEVALDWIVPGTRGEDAPLSAAASRDSAARLQTLSRKPPARSDTLRHEASKAQRKLRVAHGLPFNDYIGTSIAVEPGAGGPWKAWLALVETIPAGTEGTPVERNLVRNVFEPPWDGQRKRLFEARPMWIPDGAKGQRLRVIGWVEDSRGRIGGIAQSICPAPGSKE